MTAGTTRMPRAILAAALDRHGFTAAADEVRRQGAPAVAEAELADNWRVWVLGCQDWFRDPLDGHRPYRAPRQMRPRPGGVPRHA